MLQINLTYDIELISVLDFASSFYLHISNLGTCGTKIKGIKIPSPMA